MSGVRIMTRKDSKDGKGSKKSKAKDAVDKYLKDASGRWLKAGNRSTPIQRTFPPTAF